MRPCGALITIALAQSVLTGCYRSDVIPRSELWRLDGMHEGSPRFIPGADGKPIKIDTNTQFIVVTHGRALEPAQFRWIDVSNGWFEAFGHASRLTIAVAQIDRIEVETHDAAESNTVVGTIYGLFLVLVLTADVVLIALAAGAGY